MSTFMLFVFFCFCAVLCMAFFLYGKHCGESNAYGLGICVSDLDLRISNAEAVNKTLRKQLYEKEIQVEDFKKLADTYVKESIQYYERIQALEEELDKYKHYYRFGEFPNIENFVDTEDKRPKKKPGRPRRTLPKAPLLDEAS